jgi:hypothetical protein
LIDAAMQCDCPLPPLNRIMLSAHRCEIAYHRQIGDPATGAEYHRLRDELASAIRQALMDARGFVCWRCARFAS